MSKYVLLPMEPTDEMLAKMFGATTPRAQDKARLEYRRIVMSGERVTDPEAIREGDRLGEIAVIAKNFATTLESIGGCSDGNCVVVKPKGMHTNGGCRCSEDRMTARRVMTHAAYALRDILSIISR